MCAELYGFKEKLRSKATTAPDPSVFPTKTPLSELRLEEVFPRFVVFIWFACVCDGVCGAQSLACSLRFPFSASPLHVVAWQGGPATATALVTAGIPVDSRDLVSGLPLCSDVADVARSRLVSPSQFGRTPLHVSAMAANVPLFTLLLQLGADVLAVDNVSSRLS